MGMRREKNREGKVKTNRPIPLFKYKKRMGRKTSSTKGKLDGEWGGRRVFRGWAGRVEVK